MKIIFICTGNTCRSAMAEGILKKYIKEANLDIEVYSAGIYAENGANATYTAIEAVAEYGVDLKTHKSTNIKNSPIEQMDLILCATEGHKKIVIQIYPNLKEKTMTMKEYAYGKTEQNLDIADPWGYDITTYRKCASEIEKIAQKIVEKLQKTID